MHPFCGEKAMKLKLTSSSSTKSPFINLSVDGKELPMARLFNKRRSTLSVDEEYAKALHSNSYIDIWAKGHQQLERINSSPSINTTTNTRAQDDDEENEEEEERLVSPFSHTHYSHLPRFLLEPVQETLVLSNGGHFHLRTLLHDYFDTTFQACTACASLLASIDSARSHHHALRRLLLSLSHSPKPSTFAELAALLELDNPLSPPNLAHFNRTHALFSPLIARLTSTHRRISRRMKLIRVLKKAAGLALITACGAVLVAALVVVTHAVAVIGAVPVVLVGPQAATRWARRSAEGFIQGWLKKASRRVDAAAKGAYIVARDLDTMSRMVRRAEWGVERGRDVARMAVRNRERHLVQEVAREVEGDAASFVAQLGELEEHVYLCLLTINRSRRLVVQEMVATMPSTMTST